jgi:hypothetical protein
MTQIIASNPPDIFDARAELLAKLTRRPDCDSPGFVFLELPKERASDGEDLNAFVSNEVFDWAGSEWTVAISDTPWYAADPDDIREYAAALTRAATHADILNAEVGISVQTSKLHVNAAHRDLMSVTFPDGHVNYRWGFGVDLEGHGPGETWDKTFGPLDLDGNSFPGWTVTQHYYGEFVKVGTEVRSGVEYTLLASSSTIPQESKKARTAIRASIEISASEAKETTLNTILDPKSDIDAIQIAELAHIFGANVNKTSFPNGKTVGESEAFTDVTVYLGDVHEQASNVSRIDLCPNDDGVWEISPYFGHDSEYSGDEFAAMIEKSKIALALTAALNGQAAA